ncbi:MAG: hypothetical protein ACO390_17565 [bacterium]
MKAALIVCYSTGSNAKITKSLSIPTNIASRLSSEVSEPSHPIYKRGWENALRNIKADFQPEFFEEIEEHFDAVKCQPQLQDLRGLCLLDSFSEELREYIEEYVEAWLDPFNKKDWKNYLEGYLDEVDKFLEVQAQS